MPTPTAEVLIDDALVRALLAEQHRDLAHLPLTAVGQGWDNAVYRLGDSLAVRLPRRAVSAPLIEHEQRWLPALAPALPLEVPAPVRIGRPGCGYPWSWSVVPWLPGRTALESPPEDDAQTAGTLAEFLRALHQPAPTTAPRNPWRGVPLSRREQAFHEHMDRLQSTVDRAAILAAWSRARRAPPWDKPACWIHGDLHPGNMLVDSGRLSAVIDFGDLAAGDPATDLSVVWMALGPVNRARVRRLACGSEGWLDHHTWDRARGWALALGLAYAAIADDEPSMRALGRRTVNAVLGD